MISGLNANKKTEAEITQGEDDFFSEENLTEAVFLLMRVLTAVLMIHHGQEKLLSIDLFTKFTIDKYFGFLPGPHKFYTIATGYVQYIAPFFMGLGVFSRAAALSLAGTMAGALFYSKVAIGLEGFPNFELRGLNQVLKYGVAVFHNYTFETPALYMFVFLLVIVAGPGKFSLAQLLGFNDDKSLLGKLKQ